MMTCNAAMTCNCMMTWRTVELLTYHPLYLLTVYRDAAKRAPAMRRLTWRAISASWMTWRALFGSWLAWRHVRWHPGSKRVSMKWRAISGSGMKRRARAMSAGPAATAVDRSNVGAR